MTWNTIMGYISTIALLLPILFIVLLRLGNYRTFPALLFYYVIIFSYNLFTEGLIKVDRETISYWNVCNNMLDAPLMLMFLSYFSTSPAMSRKIKTAILLVVLFEFSVILIKGFNADAITIFLGPAIAVVFSFCLVFFIRQTKMAIVHTKALGKAFMAASQLFAYGCYSLIYLIYYVFKTPHIADTFLVYFFVTTLSSLLLCVGIIFEKQRIKKLNEVKVTRKELSDIYKDTNMAAPIRTAMLDFDKEQWN